MCKNDASDENLVNRRLVGTISDVNWKRRKEFLWMAFNAVDSYRELKKTNSELAEELFYMFDHEFKQLVKCLNARRDLEHEYSLLKLYHIRKKHVLKHKLQSANACIDFQREMIYDHIKTLRTAESDFKFRGGT